jgi:4-carboxymuconolactone decarboxylase
MSHFPISEHLNGKTVEWMEQVSDADFNAPIPGQAAPTAASGPSRAQQLNGDVAPKNWPS